MEMNGEEHIAAPREEVYAALNDPEVLKKCIPGCKSIEMKSDTELLAKVGLTIGPVKATFTGNVTLEDLDPPNGYTISGQGKGGPAGFAKGGAKVSLAEDGAGTLLSYQVNADVGGKIAQLGSRLIDSTAKKLAKQFFSSLSDHFQSDDANEGAAAPSTPEVVAHPASVDATEEVATQTKQAAGDSKGSKTWVVISIVAAAAVAFLLLR